MASHQVGKYWYSLSQIRKNISPRNVQINMNTNMHICIPAVRNTMYIKIEKMGFFAMICRTTVAFRLLRIYLTKHKADATNKDTVWIIGQRRI